MKRSYMTDHEFSAWLRKRDLHWQTTRITHNIQEYKTNDILAAIIIYENSPPISRIIYINE